MILQTDKPKIRAIAPWFGGKRTLAGRIVEQLGKHSAYWEPFCGGMSIVLAKPESSHETVNDLHGDLINLARVIACPDRGPVLHERLQRVLCDECVRDESIKAMSSATDAIERAYHYFIESWMGRNGFSGTTGSDRSSFAVRWTPNGGHGGQRFASAVDSLPSWHNRLRRVTILQRDAFEVVEKIDDHPRVAIYCDPPYIEKNATYSHDFKSIEEHERLAELLNRKHNARVVVSYYQHDDLERLYPPGRWSTIDATINKGLHNAGKRGREGRKAPEVILVNGPVYSSCTEALL